MERKMKATFIIPLLAAMAAPSAAKSETPKPDTPRLDSAEERELAQLLDGKVAGKPVSCVDATQGHNLQALGDHVLVYKVSKKLVYRNDLLGACTGLRFGDTLVMHVFGSEYCRGDIARVVNLTTGSWTGSCALGEFVPYRTPEADTPGKK
jgi:hypothetical protein